MFSVVPMMSGLHQPLQKVSVEGKLHQCSITFIDHSEITKCYNDLIESPSFYLFYFIFQ